MERVTMEELEVKRRVADEFKNWALLEEIFWRHKSRELWLKEGDKNTRFLYKMANSRKRRNFPEKLRINGALLEGENNIKEGVTNAFHLLLSEMRKWWPSIKRLVFNSLSPAVAVDVELPFFEGEFFQLSSLCGDKTPGLDDFTLALWQDCWDVVKSEVMGFFSDFYETGCFERSLNATFVVLVPKKWGVEDFKDFRYISLVEGLYKLLAKVLANRLKKAVGSLVSNFQHAFVEGRQILDAVLIANETIDSRLKDNLSGFLCKLDIEKAYDHVSWNCVIAIMEKMGFDSKWLDWLDGVSQRFASLY